MSMTVSIDENEVAKAFNWHDLDLVTTLRDMTDLTSEEELADLLVQQIGDSVDDRFIRNRPRLAIFLGKVKEAAVEMSMPEGESA